jgi:hypothetical protein
MREGELGGFGDARLRKLGAELLAAMQQAPTMCLHALARDRNQALRFGGFLDNGAVSAHEMLVHAGRLTGQRAAGRHILAIQDTTELHFAGHAASKRGFGAAGNGRDLGLFVHPIIAAEAQTGGLIGLVSATVINRIGGAAEHRKKRPADAKESRRWLSGAETAAEVLADAAMITMVADRESDIYDQFARRPPQVHLLTRAAQDRVLAGNERLFAQIAAWPEQGRTTIEIPARGGRPAPGDDGAAVWRGHAAAPGQRRSSPGRNCNAARGRPGGAGSAGRPTAAALAAFDHASGARWCRRAADRCVVSTPLDHRASVPNPQD